MTPLLSLTTALPADVDVVGLPVATGLVLFGPERTSSDLIDMDALAQSGFEGKVGETTTLPGPDGSAVIAVGVGEPDVDGGVTVDVVRRASAALVKAAWKRTSIATRLLDAVSDAGRPAAAQALAEGTLLAAYRFGRYKRDPGTTGIESVAVVGKGGKRVVDALERGTTVAGAVALARDLVNTPAGDLTPPTLADIAVKVATDAGLDVEVIDEKQAAKLGLGGIVGVGKGSDKPPRLVKLTYAPDGARSTLALVGKGITFDSGGLSIKPADGMMTMKIDMSGAAAVLAAMSVLPTLGPRVRVVGYLCLAENMPSGRAIRPGDVLTIGNGTTVEVLNTDAEGRLVLADGLSMAVTDGADAVIDLATLTGACVVSLGNKIAGLMGNDDGLVEQVRTAANRAGESVWPLPLPNEYRKQLDSEIADLRNISGSRYGGALTAGLFLQEFVGDVPWAHLDIAGPVRTEEEDAYGPKGATGFGVRTIVEMVLAFRKPGRR